MSLSRRTFVSGSLALIPLDLAVTPHMSETRPMYGLIRKVLANPDQRDAFSALLLEATAAMPGCVSDILANDPADPNALWITEVWESKEAHAASLNLPAVQQAMLKGRPLIASFTSRTVTTPIGGHGLPSTP